MFSKPLAAGLLVLACVTAAVGGAYVAARGNAAPAEAAAVPVAAEPASTPSPGPAVKDTEAVVAPPTPAEPLEEPSPEPLEKPSGPAPAAAARSVKPASAPPAVARRTTAVNPAPTARPSASGPDPASAVPNPRAEAPAAARTEAATPLEAERPRDAGDRERGTEPVPPAPSGPELVELEIPAASVIGLQIETPVSTERARIEDRVEARVMRDVSVDGRTAIPAGTRAIGAVTLVERGGKVKERARLGVRFHTLVLADGTQLPIRTDAIMREGESPAGDSARKIGGAAVGGAILGALIGGKKGALIGGATGAAGGTAIVQAGDRSAATLASGAVVTVRLSAPVTVEVEKKE